MKSINKFVKNINENFSNYNKTIQLLEDIKCGGRRQPIPRPTKFIDRTKYDRKRAKSSRSLDRTLY